MEASSQRGGAFQWPAGPRGAMPWTQSPKQYEFPETTAYEFPKPREYNKFPKPKAYAFPGPKQHTTIVTQRYPLLAPQLSHQYWDIINANALPHALIGAKLADSLFAITTSLEALQRPQGHPDVTGWSIVFSANLW